VKLGNEFVILDKKNIYISLLNPNNF